MEQNSRLKLYAILVVCLFGLVGLRLFKFEGLNLTLDGVKDDTIAKVFSRNALQDAGHQLAEQGYFKEALAKYQEAIQAQYISFEYQKGPAVGAMRKIYKVLQEYDAALDTMSWTFENSLDKKPTKSALEKEREIRALKEYHASGNDSVVRDFISQFLLSYKEELPPQNCGMGCSSLITTLLQLYNTIGDHDAGIKLIDETLHWVYNRDDSELKNIKPPKTAIEALDAGKWNNLSVKERDPEWRAYKFVWQYLTVREAFEQDKIDGFKGCAHSPPGQVCMGKATKALIQSDYFPW